MARSIKNLLTHLLGILAIVTLQGNHLAYGLPWKSLSSPGLSCKIDKHPDVVRPLDCIGLVFKLTAIFQSDLIGTNYTHHVRAVTLPSGQTYRYVHYHPRSPNASTILFLHGWPSSSYDWRQQFAYFASRGYGIVAPDALGFGGTDKPSDAAAYTLKKQADSVIELLDCIGVGKLVTVSHDLCVYSAQ